MAMKAVRFSGMHQSGTKKSNVEISLIALCRGNRASMILKQFGPVRESVIAPETAIFY
jgi:hypothetical protein